MSAHEKDELVLNESLIEMEYDLDLWAGVIVGFDEKKNFILRIEYNHCNEASLYYGTDVIVEPEEAYRLAHSLGVRLVDLPAYFNKKFGKDGLVFDSLSVKRLFDDLIDFVTLHKTNYRKRPYRYLRR